MSGQLSTGNWQTRDEAIASNSEYVAEMIASDMLGFAAHGIQDPSVHDYAEWHKFKFGTPVDVYDTWSHLVKDQAHVPAMIAAYEDTLEMFREIKKNQQEENDEKSQMEEISRGFSDLILQSLCQVGMGRCKKGIARFK